MDKEKLKQFKIPIALTALALLLLFYFGSQTFHNISELNTNKQTYQAKSQELKEKQEKLNQIKQKLAQQARKEAEMKTRSKQFYKPAATGMNTEAVIAGEFSEILNLIRANRIKIRSIKYDYDPQDDNFVKNAGSTYKAARLNMEMIANYTSLNNYLKELYKHDHFLDIQSVEIVPYRKNKQILLINFKLKLYSSTK